MEFRIADTFTDSLSKLSGEEQKAVKTTAFDLQLNPAHPSLSFHKLDKARDKSFWSVRVSRDIRVIVHKTEASFLLCYVDHHDNAYNWAERRKLEVHPKTGAAQFVEIRETVQEIRVPVYVPTESTPSFTSKKLFSHISEETLLNYGVPVEWLADVKAADDELLYVLVDHLPAEAAEALIELATGGTPNISKPAQKTEDPFAHPDAQRRFRTMGNVEELQQALDYPWDKWAVFLHPDQRATVTRNFNGPARVSGSAGTGKTIVALHRAVHLAREHPQARLLLTTFSEILASALRVKLRRLVSSEPHLAERIDVEAINKVGLRLYKTAFVLENVGKNSVATPDQISNLIGQTVKETPDQKFSLSFLLSEWEQVVDAWQLRTWEDYRDVKRLGRKTKLPESQRAKLWSIFSKVIVDLKAASLITLAEAFSSLTDKVSVKSPYDFIVVDEAQDITVYHLRLLAALGGTRPNALFFAGDIGQRIFQQPFSWKSLGVSVQGRSKTLTVNYRTSHQIRRKADQLLNSELSDADGNVEIRNKTISLFNGPTPEFCGFDNQEEESTYVGQWIAKRHKDGLSPHEIGVFVRSIHEIDRAKAAVESADLPYLILDERVETISTKVAISTMHLAKGLEFKVVIVMACDDEVIPSQDRIDAITDFADLEDVYNTERHLLYVACTRARDQLLVTSVNPSSEFLDDFKMN
ncbi:UvrD-helicase domain-containing protein [Dyadobacter sp. CY327]|uniref:3'-5' exonuclease n=1 Tax=Dyadobacter sp. CY327 TaxID=2907301 RepID=UPI001F15A09A|nr:3'-5' exonuclease [Dyadobacter sp. CY327]MCE7070940.1 UvrD-helicase domain-containing protein [Dyadobacter sp. CY327]